MVTLNGNGAGPISATGGSQRAPIPTPAQITALVDDSERYSSLLQARMEEDWDLLTLEPFDAGKGYREYTSNEPLTYFGKMTSALASGELKVRIPTARARREKREREAAAERFYIGILEANDERLLGLGQPRLQDSLASLINLRGWYCGRSILVQDPVTGQVYPDITAWDPLHVFRGMGPKGLKWICHKSKMTAADVWAAYGVDSSGGLQTNGFRAGVWDLSSTDGDPGVDVYDWYDEENNIVVVGGKYAKPPTPHTPLRRVPSFFGAVGHLPLIQSLNRTSQDNLRYQGESIYAANRRIYAKVNLIYSTMLQLVALSRDHAFYITGGDGTKQLPANPFLEGSQFSLPEGYTFNIVELLEMSRDTGAFLGLVSAEIQRGALPYSTYGQLAFQLSGYAVNLLKQATDAPIMPRGQAMENAYYQICRNIGDQFATGAYGAMQLRGYGQNREWFDEEFEPAMIVGLPSLRVTLKVNTPQDEMQKMQMARLASEGPWPLLPNRHIWDVILDIQDTDSLEDAIKEQVGERLLPEAALMVLLQAAERQGRPELAQLYFLRLIKETMMGQPPTRSGDGSSGGGGGGSAGFTPQSLPASEQGQPPPQPTPQAGPNVPAGSSRPGASVPPVVRAWGPT